MIPVRTRPNPSAFDKVRKLAFGLTDVTEGTAYGSPALKVRGKMFAVMTTHKSAEPNTLAVRLSFVDRDWLIAQSPDVYYLKAHYVNYPCVLVRLDRVKPKDLGELFVNSRDFVASLQKPRKSRATKPRGARR